MARKKASGSPQTQERKRQEKAARAQKRQRVRLFQIGAGVAAVAAVVVVLTAMAGRSERAARDLSLIGTGVPAVVQVHDVSCPTCSRLRANIDRIKDEYSDDELVIRIADIREDDALRFAARYTNERRQTLLFLDGNGELVDITVGLLETDSLRTLFDDHAGR